MSWKKTIKDDSIPGSRLTDPSNLLLIELELSWYKMPNGTRFKYYNPSNRKDIMSGEGGSVVAELKHDPKSRKTYERCGYNYYPVKHKSITYYLCSFRDKLVLIEDKEIRIIEPKKKAKK